MGIPHLEHLACLGRGYAGFRAAVARTLSSLGRGRL